MLTIVNNGSQIMIVNKGLSLTIVSFFKTIVFEEKNYMQFYWMSSYMKLNSGGGTKTIPDIFLKTTQCTC